MAIASITGWLNNPHKTYHQGHALYEQYGDNPVLKVLLKSGSTSYHLAKLKAGLEEVNKKSNLVPKPIVISQFIPEQLVSPGKTAHDYKDAPEKILQIRDLKTNRYAQARKLFEMIRVLDSADLRKQAALEMLDHMDFVNESWAVIDEWKANGVIREIEEKQSTIEIADLCIPDLLKESKNLPSYISKAKTKLAKAKTPTSQVKASARLHMLERRYEIIKQRMEAEFK
jgi:hypothetical protein